MKMLTNRNPLIQQGYEEIINRKVYYVLLSQQNVDIKKIKYVQNK